jgi:hypothetical protein
MDLLQVASTVADTVKAPATPPGLIGSVEALPAFVWVLIAALIGLVGALIGAWVNNRVHSKNREAQRRQFEESQKRQREQFEESQRRQREQFEEEWKRRLEHEIAQRLAAEQREEDRQKKVEATDESRYLDWVISEHRFLPITGLRTRSPIELELERVYISLSVDPRSLSQMGVEEEEVRRKRLRPEDLSALMRREERKGVTIADALKLIDDDKVSGLVILGGPGTGKTTVLKYLALTYARGLYGERLNQSRSRLPIFVPLRTVVAGEHEQPLADYMTTACNTAGCKVSPTFFDERLKAGDCIILLDGLDEVADETQRKQVAHWVEKQCKVYHRNPFVVTCRVAGFREDYLPPRFLRLDIQDFSEKDIAQFARNWCLAVETMLKGDSDEARRQGEKVGEDLIRAIQANDRVKALAVNPLMLSIIALVHRYRAKLPERRVDLYEECVEVLLGHWDEAKDMKVYVPPGKSLQVLQPLALWMHEQKQGVEGERIAKRDEIEPIIKTHLVSIGLKAEEAGGFLDSIRDRSGLLEERGLGIFGFQHQTFQEYLAAREIAERGKTSLLVSHFGESYWREVTLLCAGIRDASDLIKGILSLSHEKVTEHWRLVLQALDEALSVNEETRKALFARPFDILKQATDPIVAVRASLWLRRGMPDVDTLIRAFDEAEGELAKGHFALLLGETGNPKAIEVLKPHLTDDNRHIRYLSALALDMLGFDRGVLDDLLLVKVPTGEFTMGSKRSPGASTPRKISTGAFLIDRFPLTNAQHKRFIKAGGYRERRYWSEEGWEWKEKENVSEPRFLNNPEFNVLSAPVVGISWYEAEAYAKWAGKRLPTEKEWERAARGDEDDREYPWGDEFDPNKCNTSEGGISQPTPVGSYPGGVSPHGCYDMAGNVWEWTESLYEREPGRVVRGGSWFSYRDYARCSDRFRVIPGLRNDSLGVRFSRTPRTP